MFFTCATCNREAEPCVPWFNHDVHMLRRNVFFLLHVQRAHVYLLNICPRIRTCLEGGDHKQFNLKDEAGKGRGKGQGCHYHFSRQSYAPGAECNNVCYFSINDYPSISSKYSISTNLIIVRFLFYSKRLISIPVFTYVIFSVPISVIKMAPAI